MYSYPHTPVPGSGCCSGIDPAAAAAAQQATQVVRYTVLSLSLGSLVLLPFDLAAGGGLCVCVVWCVCVSVS